jgi:uncharacterized membrane protein
MCLFLLAKIAHFNKKGNSKNVLKVVFFLIIYDYAQNNTRNETAARQQGFHIRTKKPERNESFSPARLISFKHFQVVVSTFSQIHYNIHSSFFH